MIARSIVDTALDTRIACNGRATMRSDGEQIRYDEVVAVSFGGRTVRATRTYFYRTQGATLIATFEDGRPFFDAAFNPEGTMTVVHHCGEDLYIGTLTLRDDIWQTRWDVTGTKALSIETNYTRAIPG